MPQESSHLTAESLGLPTVKETWQSHLPAPVKRDAHKVFDKRLEDRHAPESHLVQETLCSISGPETPEKGKAPHCRIP